MLARHQKFMDLAHKMCYVDRSHHRRYSVGAVLVKRNQVISLGCNRAKTHTRAKAYHSQCLHAEIDCMIGVDHEKLQGATIYTYRINRSGLPGISKPCDLCEQILRQVGVKAAYFLNREPEIERMKL